MRQYFVDTNRSRAEPTLLASILSSRLAADGHPALNHMQLPHETWSDSVALGTDILEAYGDHRTVNDQRGEITYKRDSYPKLNSHIGRKRDLCPKLNSDSANSSDSAIQRNLH